MKDDLKGIKGWLLFFTILFIIAGAQAFYGIFSTSIYNALLSMIPSEFPKIGLLYNIVKTLASIIVFTAYLLTVIFILRKKKSGKTMAILTIWLGFAFLIITNLASIPHLNIVASSAAYSGNIETVNMVFWTQTIHSWIAHAAYTIVTTLYFVKSKRVRNTLVN